MMMMLRRPSPHSSGCRYWRTLFVYMVLLFNIVPVCSSSSSSMSLPVRLYGVNYSLRQGPDWAPYAERCKSAAQAQLELQQIRQIADNIRVFSLTDCDTASVLVPLTQQLGLGLWLGIWVGPERSNFDAERARLLELLAQDDDDSSMLDHILGIHVTSESMYREELTYQEVVELRDTIHADWVAAGMQDKPVTVAEIIDNYIAYPDLIQVDEHAVTINQFPFWEPTVNINTAAQYMEDRFQFVEDRAGDRTIIVTETGWADAGVSEQANTASPASMAKWLRDFVCLAQEHNWLYFWFNSHDSEWRRVQDQLPYDVEGHFGACDCLFVRAVV